MKPDQIYRIETKDGKLFCKCRYDPDGGPILITKNAEISLHDLSMQVYRPFPVGRSGKKNNRQ